MAATWQPQPDGLRDLVQCLKDAETGDSETQRAVLQVSACSPVPPGAVFSVAASLGDQGGRNLDEDRLGREKSSEQPRVYGS